MSIVGANIFYSMDNNTLMWCDIFGGQVFSMDLSNHNKMHMFKILGEKEISFCVPIEGKKNQYIVGAGKRLLLVTWDGVHTMGKITKVLCEIPISGVRLTQFKVDKMGRLFFGTMIDHEDEKECMNMEKRIGAIYRFSVKDGLEVLKESIGFSHGMAWNSTWTKMYFVDSYDLFIYEFDYDLKTGNISNQKVFLDLNSYGQTEKVFLTSLTMDHNDYLYCAMFGNGKILKINTKTHKIEEEILMNVQQLSCVEFGGQQLDTMYVASVSLEWTPQSYPAGFMNKVTNLGTKGVPMPKFAMK